MELLEAELRGEHDSAAASSSAQAPPSPGGVDSVIRGVSNQDAPSADVGMGIAPSVDVGVGVAAAVDDEDNSNCCWHEVTATPFVDPETGR